MIKRSVPGYTTIIATTGLMAGRYSQSGSRLYDLGCSLGAGLLAMAEGLKDIECTLIGDCSSGYKCLYITQVNLVQ